MSDRSPPSATPPSSAQNKESDPDGNRNKKKKKKPINPGVRTGFVGKSDEIRDHVYDVTPGRNGFDVFAKTTTEIAEYISRAVPDAGEFRTALHPDFLAFDPLTPPPVPVNRTDFVEKEQWKVNFKKHSDALENREKKIKQAYAIVWGQCSPTVQDRIKAHNTHNAISTSHDVIGLLKLIRTSMYTGATSKDRVHALIDAMHAFYNFKQGPRMDNGTYLRVFKSLVETIDHLDGDFGIHPSFIRSLMIEAGLDPDNSDLFEVHKARVREEFLAKHLILKADPRRFGMRIASIQNSYISGVDMYPKTLSKAYDMLVNYVNPNRVAGNDNSNAESGMSFHQQTEPTAGRGGRGGRGGRTNAGRSGAGRQAGRGGRGPASQSQRTDSEENYDEDNYEVEEEEEIGGSNTNSNSGSVRSYSSTTPHPTDSSFNVCTAEDIVLQHGVLPDRWLLLDSCSTTDIVANRNLLHDVHPAPDQPTWVRCNAGRVKLTHQGFLGDYPYPVWYNPKGVANILSLANVSAHYRVTIDTTASTKTMFVHRTDGSTIAFTPSSNGLYKHELRDPDSVKDMWTMLSTVSERASNYSKRAYKRALLARQLQNIIMRPNNRKYTDVILDSLRDCPITRRDIQNAEDIFGPNLGSLKGKTVRHQNVHVDGGVDPVPPDIMTACHDVTIAIDIMFVNKIPFFVTKSRDLKFGTIEVLPNRHVPTVRDCLNKVVTLYQNRGFAVPTILADSEFELLRPWYPNINTAAANEHVPDIERYIRTIKDHTRSAYTMLPYRRLPRIVLIHLVKNAVFWLNAFPTGDGPTRKHSPRYLLTGKTISYKKHMVLEFGSYVQTHEQHTNDMTSRTLGCICLGPTGNEQGGHWFMSLATGERLVRYRWTHLPMPQDAIDRLTAIANKQGMLPSITYANRQGVELTNSLSDYEDDVSNDDESYQPSNGSQDDSTDTSSEGSHASEHTDQESIPQDSESESDEDDDDQGDDTSRENEIEANDGVLGDGLPPQLVEENDDEDSGVGEDTVVDDQLTEYERFLDAIEDGRNRAANEDDGRPVRARRNNQHDDFIYKTIHTFIDKMRVEDSYVTEQMSAKAGLKVFGERGSDAIANELRQLVDMKVMTGCRPQDLTSEQKAKALKYLMFLKEKRCGRIKGRGCADGRKQRLYKTKAETSSPTVSVEALMLSCLIDAMEGRDVATCDIPGAFMQADIDEEIHIKFDGELVDLLVSVDPNYVQYVGTHRGKKFLYALLNKALYGTVQASLLFWKRLSSFLIETCGFERNPYDHCVVNKCINDKQCTILWYVDDLKISHLDEQVVGDMIKRINDEFGRQMNITSTRGKIHNYLGIQMDFRHKGKVVMSMLDYIDELLKECPDDMLKGTSASPAASHLYEVNEEASKLDEEATVIFHHLAAKLLYLSKRTRPDLQTAVSFLTTRVLSPDVDDWKKLGRCIRFLRDTRGDKHTLRADTSGVIRWWIDASFAVHGDMKSHTGATMSMGKGSVYSVSKRQRLNTTSSTEAELVGVSDVMGLILWTRRFLRGQGYTIVDNVVYQDNESAMLLENNGRMSSSKRTRHIDIRYFFVTDNIASKLLRVEHCPTDDMIADYFTKPLQGSKFRKFRNFILNLDHEDDGVLKECVGTISRGITEPLDTHETSSSCKGEIHHTSWIEVKRKNKNSKSVTPKRVETKCSLSLANRSNK